MSGAKSDPAAQAILEEVLAIVEQQKVLQSRLEELLITLKVKGEFGQLSPVRSVPVKVVGVSQISHQRDVDDDDDLGPAPIGFSGDGSSLGMESGWERATPHGRVGGGGDEGAGKSSLSLSYSFSPVVNNSNLTRIDFSDGLSPAPLASSTLSSSSIQKPTSSGTPGGPGGGLFSEAAAVLSASTLRLFGSPPRYRDDERQPGGASALLKEEEEAEDEDDDEDDAKSEKNVADESDSSNLTPLPVKKEAVSAEVRAEREAQAATMTMSALSLALGAHLAEAGAPSKQRGLKETVEDSCKILGLAVSGNLKKDAAACYAVWGPATQSSSIKPSSPSKVSTHSSASASASASSYSSSLPSSSSSSSTPASPTRAAAGLQSPACTPLGDSTPQSAPPPSALGIFSPTSSSSFSSRLREYYRVHNPTKIHECDKISATYSGREEVLISKLEKLYNAKFPL